ncbi:hypothetical protein BGZ49_003301 [Haplosporangium sp. Z 27]|nr:hypothetical protein BGZ49_003301 [Haplosporangium sp. Z 27]
MSTQTPVVFTIPEILERILSFLSSHKRQRVARFVCKRWHSVCRDIAPIRPWIWYPSLRDEENSMTLNALRSIRILQLTSWPKIPQERTLGKHLTDAMSVRSSWGLLISGIELQLQQHQTHPDQRRQPALPLQELEFCYQFAEGEYFNQMLPLLPQFSFLSILRLETIAKPDRVFLTSILRTCPSLEEFSVVVAPTHFKAIRLNNDTMEDLPLRERSNPISPLPTLKRLKTLVIHNMLLTRGAAELVVEASPNLKSFTIYQAFTIPPSWQQQIYGSIDDSVPLFNRTRFLQLVASICPNLRYFHLSIRDEQYSEEQMGIFMESPMSRLSTWSFSDLEIVRIGQGGQGDNSIHYSYSLPETLSSMDPLILKAHHHRLTRLELLRNPHQQSCRDAEIKSKGVLHHFLCQAIHLQHLIAINVVIDIESLDVNGLLKSKRSIEGNKSSEHVLYEELSLGGQQSGQSKPPIWACRSLLTLHVTIDNCDFLYPESISELQVNSRIVFGYISKCCPRLQDINLKRRHSDMSQGSGFCLLSRLQDLERIALTSSAFLNMKIGEFDWLESQNYRYPRNTDDSIPKSTLSQDLDLSAVGLQADIKQWARESQQGNLLFPWKLFSRYNISAESTGVCWPQLECFKVRAQIQPLTLGAESRKIDAMHIQQLIYKNWPKVKVIFESLLTYD